MIEYKDWKLNPKLKKDIFVFKAPVNAKQLMFDMTESTNHQKK
jgi:outer membrane lipoprotein-sorting protein